MMVQITLEKAPKKIGAGFIYPQVSISRNLISTDK